MVKYTSVIKGNLDIFSVQNEDELDGEIMKSQDILIHGDPEKSKLGLMQWDVTMIHADNYASVELIQELIPEKYLWDDAGRIIFAATFFNSETTVGHLIEFLFQTKEPAPELYRDANSYILNLSAMKERLLGFEELDLLYPNWLQITGRENTMDEFGMLGDFVGFGRAQNRRYLLMIITERLG